MKSKTKYSVIIPVLNEEGSLKILYSQLKTALDATKKQFEIIFVDDGSTDNSLSILEKFRQKNKKIKIIQFRKNFGKTPALMAGFDLAKGEIIATLDGDLQNDPKDLPRFFKKIEQGYDVVNGWRFRRQDPNSKLLPSKIYNKLAQIITRTRLHDSNCGFKAFRKEALQNISLYGEMHRYIPVVLASQGYKIAELKIVHHPRRFGKSKYGLVRIFKGFLDLLYVKFWLDFSTRPIHLLGGIGIIQYILAGMIFIEQIIKAIVIKYFSVGPLLTLAVLFTTTGTLCILFGFLAEIQIRTYFSNSKIQTYSIKKVFK